MSGEEAPKWPDIAKMIKDIIERRKQTNDNALPEEDILEVDKRRGKLPWPYYKKRKEEI